MKIIASCWSASDFISYYSENVVSVTGFSISLESMFATCVDAYTEDIWVILLCSGKNFNW